MVFQSFITTVPKHINELEKMQKGFWWKHCLLR